MLFLLKYKKTLMYTLRGQGKFVLPTASTGIAAALYDGGRTGHNRFGIPVPIDENSCSKFKFDSIECSLIKESSLIFCDEATMNNKFVYNLIDRLLREIIKTDVSFGGKCFIMCGYIRQTLPVMKGKTTLLIYI